MKVIYPAFKRFYRQVTVQSAEGGFVVNLDQFKVKTPHKRVLLLPSEALALAVATEFEVQKDEINYYSMPLFKYASAGYELVTEGMRQPVIARITSFIDNDTICYRDYQLDLRRRQEQYFNPLLHYLQTRYSIDLHEVYGVF
jgi:ATP synthase F1 complex assembly factor 2